MVLLALSASATAAGAQEVTGTVRAAAGRTPVSGAIVILAQSSGARLGATLTDDGGRFRLRAPSAGTFMLRVDVVGYRSTTTAPFALGASDSLTTDVLFPFERTQLPAVAVTATSTCARVSGDAGDAPRLWSEARKTLDASRLAIDERRFNVALRRFERTIGIPDSVLRASRIWTQTAVTQNPFETISPETVARDGFSTVRDSGRFYYAPDAAVLLSDAFVESHCFGTRRGGPGGAIGLTFRPQRVGPRVDINGVLWLDSASAELRSLEYRYVPSIGRQDVGGGIVTFGRYPSGVWGVQRWTIRLPVLHVNENTRRPDGALGRFIDTVVVAVREVGGEVVAAGASGVATPFAGTLLRGTVFDSTLGRPLPGAMVTIEGLGRTTQADADGRFVFDSLTDDGEVRLRAWHPRLDSLGLPASVVRANIRRRSENSADLHVPGVGAVARLRCSRASRTTQRVITGILRAPTDSALPSVEVVLLQRRGLGAGGSDSLLRHSEISSDLGRFAFCDVGPGAQAWLLARSGLDWTEPRHVGSDSVPAVQVVPLATLAPDTTASPFEPSGAPAVILGRTLNAGLGQRIAGWVLLPEQSDATVQVVVDDVVRATAAADGSFSVDRVAVGMRRVSFRGAKLASRNISLNVQENQSQLLVVALRTAPLVVVQRNSSSFDQRMAEFRRRRRAGGGVFLERAEIERRNPRTLTDLLRTVPGVRVLPQGTGFRYVSSHFRRVGEGTGQGTGSSHDGACDMMLYIDGLPFPSDGGEVDSRVRVEDIAAAEVYVSAGSVPRQFAGTSAACGVIVVWRGR
jgi:hypothetical protein